MISASQVARITDMSHLHTAFLKLFWRKDLENYLVASNYDPAESVDYHCLAKKQFFKEYI
jgi:hypothetical protein